MNIKANIVLLLDSGSIRYFYVILRGYNVFFVVSNGGLRIITDFPVSSQTSDLIYQIIDSELEVKLMVEGYLPWEE